MRRGPTEVAGPINPLFVVGTQDGWDGALINSYGDMKALSNHIGQATLPRFKKVRVGGKVKNPYVKGRVLRRYSWKTTWPYQVQ